MLQRTLICTLSFSMLCGCSNPRTANETNIQNALNNLLKSERLCISSSEFTMPAQIRLNEKKELEPLDVLVQAGLLTKTKKTEKIQPRSIWGAIGSDGSKEEQIYKYELTELGKKDYKKQGNPLSLVSDGAFCYGYAQVEKIESFTEPADLLGKKVIEVNFTYKLAEHSKWIEADVFKTYRSVVQAFESEKVPLVGKTTLVLTNKGWIQPSML